MIFASAHDLPKSNHPTIFRNSQAEDVIDGWWRDYADGFIMPGGADLPYCSKLNGPGNKQIQEFVRAGGSYVGFCAGAYYGSAYVEFDKVFVRLVELFSLG